MTDAPALQATQAEATDWPLEWPLGNVAPKALTDIRHLAGVAPKAERGAFFAPKLDWLARNEAVALALGAAQIAARRIDDQRIEVLCVRVVGSTAVLTVSRAPDQSSITGLTSMRLPSGLTGIARMGEGEGAVLVEWPL